MLRPSGVCLLLLFLHYGESQISPAKSCGATSIPHDFHVDLNGTPEIECDTPVCFGNSIDDPYPNDYVLRKRRHKKSILEETAECTRRFTEQVCSSSNEWTAGVMEYNNGTHLLLKAECCQYDGLNNSTLLTTVLVRPGERYTGGDVTENGKVIAFDLIKEVRKNVGANNEVGYHVTIYRMQCIPEPLERRNKISSYFENDNLFDSDDFAIPNYRMRPREEYGMGYGSSRRYRPFSRYGSQIRRRPAYYPRRRQYYRPLFEDEYDYFELEPLPVVRRPFRNRYRARYEVDPSRHYGPKGRVRAYGETAAYGGQQPEPLEEYHEQAPAYQENAKPNPLPASYGEQPAYSTQSQGQVAMPETQQSLIAPPPPTLQGYVTPTSYLSAPPPPPPPQIQASYNTYPSYQPAPQATSCVADPCAANAANQASQYNQQYNQQYSQQYSQASYPSYSGGQAAGAPDLNSVFSSLQCFSGDMTVQTPSGLKQMKDLEVGDLVLSIEQSMISYTPVVMFLHNAPEDLATFKEIKTFDGQKLKLTDFHLIYVTNCGQEPLKLVHAKDVKVGQCLHIVSESQHSLKSTKVIAITEVEELGIYAPLTVSGDIMVNSVVASCHSNVGVQTLQQTFFNFYLKISKAVNSIRSMFGIEPDADAGSLPVGVQYLTSALDVIVPKSLFA